MKLTATCMLLLAAWEASAHPGTSHAVAHNAEHLLLLCLLLAPALLLARPLVRLLGPRRRR